MFALAIMHDRTDVLDLLDFRIKLKIQRNLLDRRVGNTMTLVLLIDDDPLIAEIVTASLSEYTVGWLADGRGALRVIETKQPALVILDCSMPFVPGTEVLRAMRLSTKCCSIPVLMLTSRSSGADRDIAFHAGATDYLSKPFDSDQLAVVVDGMIEADRARSELALTRHGALAR